MHPSIAKLKYLTAQYSFKYSPCASAISATANATPSPTASVIFIRSHTPSDQGPAPRCYTQVHLFLARQPRQRHDPFTCFRDKAGEPFTTKPTFSKHATVRAFAKSTDLSRPHRVNWSNPPRPPGQCYLLDELLRHGTTTRLSRHSLTDVTQPLRDWRYDSLKGSFPRRRESTGCPMDAGSSPA